MTKKYVAPSKTGKLETSRTNGRGNWRTPSKPPSSNAKDGTYGGNDKKLKESRDNSNNEDQSEELGEDGNDNSNGDSDTEDEDSDEDGGEDDEVEDEIDNDIHENDDDDDDDDDDEFEIQSSSSESNIIDDNDDEMEISKHANSYTRAAESSASRSWRKNISADRQTLLEKEKESGSFEVQKLIHTDDLSSDDEQENVNTIGRVPLHWYDAYDHIGYSVEGTKVIKRKSGSTMDRIDIALLKKDDPKAANRTVYDIYNGRQVVLSDREIEIIRRVQAGAFAHPEFNDTPDYVDYFSSEKEIMPLSAAPEPKRRFVPSKWEAMKVMKIVQAMKEGRYQFLSERPLPGDEDKKPPVYLIWNDEEDAIIAESKRNQFHLPAPKIPLPGHSESYNPPAEYLLTDEELKKWQEADVSEREINFIPKKHDCLRHVGAYADFVKERFERCLDLYLCPRKMKRRLNIDPETLIPKLPKPQELKPFPNSLCMQYLGHEKAVRSITISPDGQYMASGSDDGTVRMWEVDTGLCRHVWNIGNHVSSKSTVAVTFVQWNPEPMHHLIAASCGNQVVLISTGTGDKDSSEVTETLIATISKLAVESKDLPQRDDQTEETSKNSTNPTSDAKNKNKEFIWTKTSNDVLIHRPTHDVRVGPRFILQCTSKVMQVTWHYKGDYLATLSAPSTSMSDMEVVGIHQLSTGKSQCPFSKSPGKVQCVAFHPSRPFFIVATQQHVKIFHLIEQKLIKKLLSGCKWISSLDVHTSGDHIIIGSYDRRVVWFDLDLSSTPYKTLKFHEKAVRSVHFHRRYPLMASAADDGNIHIFHSMVYNDLTKNPLIVPLKILRGHGVIGGVGILSIVFHPRQPWVFSAGADSIINLFQDI